jgi:hypothetical protein
MTVGISGANLANKVLDGITRTGSFPTAGTLFVKLHTGDPGSAGASNASSVTTRSAATFGSAASGGVGTMTNTPSWSMTGTETISHISLWDASTSGNFLWSVALTASKSVSNGDTLNLSSLTLTFTPIAA